MAVREVQPVLVQLSTEVEELHVQKVKKPMFEPFKRKEPFFFFSYSSPLLSFD